MWSKTTWNKKVKWVITGICGFIIFMYIIAGLTAQPRANETTAVTSTVKPLVKATAIHTLQPTKSPVTATQTAAPTTNPDRITLDSLATVLIGYDVQQSNDRFIGYSKDRQSTITLIGDKNNITTILLSANIMQPSDVMASSVLIESVLQAALPTWQGSSTWLGNALTQFSNTTDTGDSVETDVNNKHILLGYSPATNSLNLNITVK